jgi:CheY-like chemotaxis protein
MSASLMMTCRSGKMVIRYLEDQNVPTKSASNRTELNRHFRGTLPSLIILDLRLGQDDGLDLLREIRSHSDVPVIITTSHRPDEIDRIVGLELCADDYIVKPFSSESCLPASVPYCGGRKWDGSHAPMIRSEAGTDLKSGILNGVAEDCSIPTRARSPARASTRCCWPFSNRRSGRCRGHPNSRGQFRSQHRRPGLAAAAQTGDRSHCTARDSDRARRVFAPVEPF